MAANCPPRLASCLWPDAQVVPRHVAPPAAVPRVLLHQQASALCSCGMVPTRGDRCCYVLYSIQSRERTWNQRNHTQWNDKSNISIKPCVRTEADAAYEKNAGSHRRQPRNWKMRGGDHQSLCWWISLEQVEPKWNNVSQPDSEKEYPSWFWRLEWCDLHRTKNSLGKWSSIRIVHWGKPKKAIDEVEEIPVERNTKEDLHSTRAMHTMYRSLLRQINWLQSRTRFQCCYNFSRCFKSSFSNNWRCEGSQ